MTARKLKIKKGDTVKVLSGKDKGKTGKVLRVIPDAGRLVIENVNMHSKFERGKAPNQPGQKITFAAPLAIGKVMLVDPHSGNPTRIGFQFLENGTKQRVAKQSGKAI